ncbi:MAG: serine protease [Polyangiaceae bacterium]
MRAWGLLLCAVLLTLSGARSARADGAPAPAAAGKVAVGFSNLLARIDKDEIGFAKPEYRVHILEALRQAGFNAVGAENLVFNKDDGEKADLVLGGTVRELDCLLSWYNMRCRIGIEWQLLDREHDQIVYQVLTRFAHLDLPRGNDAAVGKALTMGALSLLMGRPRFIELLNAEHVALPAETDYPTGTFSGCDPKAHELPTDFDAVADGTVVVKSRDGFGSGFFLGPDGLVITAAHVVASGKVEVRLHGGKTVQGRVVRISHKQDVALIALADSGPPARPCLAYDATPQTTGADVYAIGSPASEELAFSLSRGIVSGVRTISDVTLIQTDASLSPGNSGGALVDQHGRVVGVVSRKIAGRAVEGLGFAIPIQTALTALHLEPGTVTSPALLEHGPAPADHPAAHAALIDTPDPPRSLDPEGDRQRYLQADYDRRVKEQHDRTPGYVRTLRWGGVAVGSAGALMILVTGMQEQKRMTHSDYRDLRLENDLSWAAFALGTGAFVTSFILEPKIAPSKVQSAGSWSVIAGPANIAMKVTF